MSRIWIAVTVGGLLGLGACASPGKIQEGAWRHEERARQLEAEGRYEKAAKEREAAARLQRKAAERAYWTY